MATLFSRQHRPVYCAHMNPNPTPQVEPCFRCGQPAERSLVKEGYVIGDSQVRLWVCMECFQLLMTNSEAFWKPLRERKE